MRVDSWLRLRCSVWRLRPPAAPRWSAPATTASRSSKRQPGRAASRRPSPPSARSAQWWSKDHTYSGDAARMSLQLRPGGCFCETLDGGGGIEHMRVTFVQPGERVVLTGSLGPLLYEATAA